MGEESEAAVPAESKPVVVSGKDTTEYAETQSAKTWAVVGMLFSLVLALGAPMVDKLGADSQAGIIVGGIVAIITIIYRGLIQLKYIDSRTQIKLGL